MSMTTRIFLDACGAGCELRYLDISSGKLASVSHTSIAGMMRGS